MEAHNFGDGNDVQEADAAENRRQAEKDFKALIAERGLDQPLIEAVTQVSRSIVEGNVNTASAEGEMFIKTYDADALFQSFVRVAECTDPDFAIKFAIDEAVKAGYAKNGMDIARVRLALHAMLLRKMMMSS